MVHERLEALGDLPGRAEEIAGRCAMAAEIGAHVIRGNGPRMVAVPFEVERRVQADESELLRITAGFLSVADDLLAVLDELIRFTGCSEPAIAKPARPAQGSLSAS